MGESESYNVLLNISKKDIAASKVLYENEHYPQAVFLLQQSVEKALKSLAVFGGDVKNPSREIGHNCANYYKLTTDKYKAQIDRFENDEEKTEVLCRLMGFDNEGLTESIQETKEKMESAEKVINSAIKKPSKHRFLSDKDMLHIISKLKEVESEFNLSISDNPSFFTNDEEFELYIIDKVNNIKNTYEFMISKHQEDDSFSIEKAHELKENDMKFFSGIDKASWNKMGQMIIRVNYVSKALYCLSLITDAHAVSSRYPSKNFNPIDFYTPDLSMIKNFELLLDFAEKAIDSMSYVYEEHAKNESMHKELNRVSS
ncbi:HEPN domain-containing protein [uncultured Methanolobus sp.]|uniref:HEPN domain-containing protein n=1 Tax=uncultured Methanolobus sp. TaxID=218300 RepID=UPI0029C6EA14|nr:HEPN domain-containing protein [uncultured Methanolobus sp.]